MESSKTIIVQGNEACVHGAVMAGCRFFAGYPITPASEIAEVMSGVLPKHQGIFLQMEDEIASINSAIGAAWGGMKSCTATSGPGFSLMQEGIGYAVETETPVVVFNVMRGGPSTGQPTVSAQQDIMQAKYGSHGDYEIIALCPSSVQESFELTVKAFNLAERFRVPVIVLSDEIIGHTREKLHMPTQVDTIPRQLPKASPQSYVPYRAGEDQLLDGMPVFGSGYDILVDGQLHDEYGNRAGHDTKISGKLMTRLCRKITDHRDELIDVDEMYMEDAKTVVISYGSVARSAESAVKAAREKGVAAGFIKLKTIWPFPDTYLQKIMDRVDKIVVPEMNMGKIALELERLAKKEGQVISLAKVGGELHTPDEILRRL